MKMAEVVLFGDADKIALVEQNIGYFTTLAKVDRILHGKDKPKPAASAVVENLEIFLPLGDLIDVQAELSRLLKEKTRIEERIEVFRKKLSNESFISKANPTVVTSEKEKLTSNEEALVKLQVNIDLLS